MSFTAREHFIEEISKKRESLKQHRGRRTTAPDGASSARSVAQPAVAPVVGHIEVIEEIKDYSQFSSVSQAPFDLSSVKDMETRFCATLTLDDVGAVDLQPLTPDLPAKVSKLRSLSFTPELPAKFKKQISSITPDLPIRMAKHIAAITPELPGRIAKRFSAITPELPTRMREHINSITPELPSRLRSKRLPVPTYNAVTYSTPRDIAIEVPGNDTDHEDNDNNDTTASATTASTTTITESGNTTTSTTTTRNTDNLEHNTNAPAPPSPFLTKSTSQCKLVHHPTVSPNLINNTTTQKRLAPPKVANPTSRSGLVAVFDMSGMTPRTAMNFVSSLAQQTSQVHRQNEIEKEHKAAVSALKEQPRRSRRGHRLPSVPTASSAEKQKSSGLFSSTNFFGLKKTNNPPSHP
eukprot:c17536_g1_i1.p1 GENE.c17536_g1_i1~~c17536_g1_i1.p1  ORF type:complete len:437 (-),score=111.79 c17536_g1_i1:488-1711(-)